MDGNHPPVAAGAQSERTALDRWLFDNRLTIRAAAAAWGMSHEALRLIVQGRRAASPDLAEKIAKGTKGQINLTPDAETPARPEGAAQQDGWAG